VRKTLIILLLLLVAPITLAAAKYRLGDRAGNWQTADRSSAGLLPAPMEHPEALVRVYANGSLVVQRDGWAVNVKRV
jgi:hypothetical protein